MMMMMKMMTGKTEPITVDMVDMPETVRDTQIHGKREGLEDACSYNKLLIVLRIVFPECVTECLIISICVKLWCLTVTYRILLSSSARICSEENGLKNFLYIKDIQTMFNRNISLNPKGYLTLTQQVEQCVSARMARSPSLASEQL